MAGTVEDVLHVTEEELGNTDGAKYFEYFGYADLGDWCMASQLYCIYKGGATLDWPPANEPWKRFVVPDKHDCPPRKWLDPQQLVRGALVIFDWDTDTWGDHVGICVSKHDWGCVTREGNTGNPAEFRERHREWSVILGGMMPNYTDAPKAKWIKKDGRWWYRHADGSYTRNGWEQIDGKWYYFDHEGWMLASTVVEDKGSFYALGKSGAMLTDVRTNAEHDGTYGRLML